jgi:hypothetical protein
MSTGVFAYCLWEQSTSVLEFAVASPLMETTPLVSPQNTSGHLLVPVNKISRGLILASSGLIWLYVKFLARCLFLGKKGRLAIISKGFGAS